MKMRLLFLSLTSMMVAGSSFAADLPAKKSAPAAKAPAAATGCPAFGAGYFQIPGSAGCIKFDGYAAAVNSYNNATGYNVFGYARLQTTVIENTEAGVVTAHGSINITGNSITSGSTSGADSVATRRAWVGIGGLKAGYYGSLADIGGDGLYNFDSYMGKLASGRGMQYAMPVGTSTVTIGMENAVNDGTGNTNYPNRPDLLVRATVPVATGVTADLVGVSHAPGQQGSTSMGNGFAVLAAIGAKYDAVGVRVWGAGSQGAMAYTGSLPSSSSSYDYVGSDYSKGSVMGGEVSFAGGPATLYVDYTTVSQTPAAGSTTQTNYAAVAAKVSVGKLDFKPEFVNTSGASNSNVFYLTLQRDF